MHIAMINPTKGRITADLSGGVLALIRAMPTKVVWEDRDAIFTISALNLKYLKTTFPNATWDQAYDEHFMLLDVRAREAAQLVDKKYQKLSMAQDTHVYKRAPFAHQRKALMVSKDEVAYGLQSEAGTGKSHILINTIAHLYRTNKIQQALIFSDNGLHLKWEYHCNEDMPDDIDYELYLYRTKYLNKDWDYIQSMVAEPHGLKIVSMNIEALSIEKGWDFIQWYLKQNATIVIIDEVQSIGVARSKRSRNAVKMGKLAPYRRFATGTLFAEGIQRAWAPFQFLNPNILECSRYEHFLERYTIRVGKFKKIVGTQNIDDFTNRIEPYTFAIDKKDCLDLPPQYWVARPTELSADQKRVYNQLRTDLYAEVKSGVIIEAPLMVTRIVKLQQIAGGYLKIDDPLGGPPVYHDFENCPRIRSTIELVHSIRNKVIIWCAFKREVKLLMGAMDAEGITYRSYYGSESPQGLEEFRANPEIKVLVATRGTKGFDIYEASNVIYYSHKWSNEMRTQSESRVHRPGQIEAVTYYDIFVPGTVDRRIMDTVKKKRDVEQELKAPSVVLEWLEDEPE